MWKKLLGILVVLLAGQVYAEPVKIVAAENFYGQVAKQIGGDYVQVTSLLQNPQQDPHLFSSSPATAKAMAQAQLVIFNGLGYDSWINNLINVSDNRQQVIEVGELAGKSMGSNPHIWYDPSVMWLFAGDVALRLSQMDPPHQAYYQQQLAAFKQDLQPLLAKIQLLRQQYQSTPVIATEPVFNEMANAVGLQMQGMRFQLSIMNDTEPSISDTKDFEDKLKHHQVKVLIYNNQVINPATERMQKLAQQVHIPVLGVSEMQPEGKTYSSWMMGQLEGLEQALNSYYPHPNPPPSQRKELSLLVPSPSQGEG
jgi:zinc/manganese transport system substrate-binding protein